jgi:glycosyltransferase involved in cell wall biosynthesis
MRILIIVVYYRPSVESCVQLIHDLAHEFKLRGHCPIVITPNNNISNNVQITDEQGIQVIRIKTGKIKGTTRSLRALNEIRLSHIIWRKAKKFLLAQPCDLIVYYSPTIFFGSLVNRLKKIFDCKSYLILRDIFPQWALDAGILKRGPLYSYFKRKEIQNYNAADIIGVQSSANLKYFITNHLNERYRLEVLFNWISPSQDGISQNKFRQKFGLENKIVLFYGGNMGIAQDMDNIIRLAGRFNQNPDVFFLLVGDGSEVLRLQKEAQKRNLTNLAIHPAVNQRDYTCMLSEFDIGLISLDRRLKTHNFPGKMLGYMYNAKPILASINQGNDLKDILEAHDAGLVSHNGDDEGFYNHAMQLIRNPGLREQMGRNGRILLERTFSVTNAASQILSHLSS